MKWSYLANVILASTLIFVITTSSRQIGDSEAKKAIRAKEMATMALPQIIECVDLNSDFDFAGEKMPRTVDALERIDRELTVNSYWHSNTLITLKKANRYFPIIDQILEEEGVPKDFKYVAAIESGLKNVTSPAGAKGFWQLMPAVAKSYGLTINRDREERYHMEKSTRAACKHIKRYKERFGNWTNAAAAYNMGETKFSDALSKQKESTYYNMNFGEETNRYMFRILAMKSIFENPHKYGFKIDLEEEGYRSYDTYKVEVNEDITDLAEWAHKYGCSYRMLKALNPWLISSALNLAEGEVAHIQVPKK